MRRTAAFGLKLAITAGLFWWLLDGIDFDAAVDRLADADMVWLWAVGGLAVLQLAVLAVRWHFVLRLQIGPVPPSETVHNLMVGTFFNQVLPSGIGGDAVRVWLLTRRRPAILQQAIGAVLIDRGIGLVALLLIAVVAAPWLLTGPLAASLQNARAAATILSLLAVLLVCGYAFLLLVSRLPAWSARWWQPLRATYGDLRRAMIGSRLAPLLLLLGVAGHTALLLSVVAFARGLDIPVSLVTILVLTPPAMILATLPVSVAGWGVREAGFTAMLAMAGVSTTDATLLGLCLGFLQLAQGLAGGLVWLAGRRPGGVGLEAIPARPEGRA